jgi:hypothetical protein
VRALVGGRREVEFRLGSETSLRSMHDSDFKAAARLQTEDETGYVPIASLVPATEAIAHVSTLSLIVRRSGPAAT